MEEYEKMAESLNEFFVSVFTSEDNNIPVLEDKLTEDEKMEEFTVSMEEVEKRLLNLKGDKAPGPDNIPGYFLKQASAELSKPLALIFNDSLNTGIVPRDWRVANVIPIFKKGDRDKCGNYRPVSLTSIVCKVLESILRDKINNHLKQHSLIADSQHGFSSGLSCQTNLLTFFDKIVDNMDQGNTVDVIYLDFQKAFDKVPHLRLIEKVKSLGINEQTVRWVKQWLQGRKQKVVINGFESTWADVTSGVPQGSVLGPLLFLIYINDIDQGVRGLISKFADDTKLGGIIRNSSDMIDLQADLDILTEWSEKWQMKFNTDKCKAIRFGNFQSEEKYIMNGQGLDWVTEEKDLGVIVDETMKSSKHCQAAAKKANRMLGMIGRNISSRSKEVILPLYRTLVRPHLEYCVQFWSPSLVKDVELLERVQRRATRMIPELRKLPYEVRLQKTGLYSLSRRRIRGDLIQTFKFFKGIDRVRATDLFKLRNNTSLRGHDYMIFKQPCKRRVKQDFFTNRVVNYWNSLPGEALAVGSVDSFKKHVDTFLNGGGIW